MTMNTDSWWRDIPDGVLAQDQQQTQAQQWGDNARLELAQQWGDNALQELALNHPDLSAAAPPPVASSPPLPPQPDAQSQPSTSAPAAASAPTLSDQPQISAGDQGDFDTHVQNARAAVGNPLPAPNAPVTAPLTAPDSSSTSSPTAPVTAPLQAPQTDSSGMLDRNGVIAYVQQHAPDLGLDPAAVLAVANQEGLNTAPGSHWQLKGENNISFGPPSWFGSGAGSSILAQHGDDAARWSWTPAGIDYWLSQVAPAAKGLKGQRAIAAIVNGFERPREDLAAGEVRKAAAQYDTFTQPVNATSPVAASVGAPDLSTQTTVQPTQPVSVQTSQPPVIDFSKLVQDARNAVGGAVNAIGDTFNQAGQAASQEQNPMVTTPQSVAQAGNAILQNDPIALQNQALKAVGSGIANSGLNQLRSQYFPNILEPNHPLNVVGSITAKVANGQPLTQADVDAYNNAAIAVGGLVGGEGAAFDKFGVEQGFVPPNAKTPDVQPTLEPEVAATLPPGSGPLAPPAQPQPSSDVLTGLQNLARQRGITPAEPPEAFNGGAVPTVDDLTQRLRQLTQQVNGGDVPPSSGGRLPPPNELLGPSGPQRGQLGMFGQELPTGGPRPTGNEALGPSGPQPGQFQFGSELPVGGPRPTGNEALGPSGRMPGQQVLPGVKLTEPVSPWDFIHATRVGSLAGGVQTMTHIILNVPTQAVLKLGDDLLSHPEALGVDAYGAVQGIRTWAMSAISQMTRPGQLAEKLGGGTGARITEGALEGLVKTHNVLSDLAGQLVGNSELWRQAALQAEKEGFSRLDVLSGKANQRIAELVQNPTPAMRSAAQAASDRAGLTGPMGTTGTAIAQLVRRAPVMRFILPFFNKGYHIAAQGQELLPTGMLGTLYDVGRAVAGKGPYSGPAGFAGRGANGAVAPLAQRLRNHLIGLGLMAEAYAQAANGNVTGDGPANPQAKSDLMDQGWRPDSVRIGGRYIDSHVLGPIGWALTAGANAFEASHTGEQGGFAKPGASFWDQAGDVMAREGRYFENETFLRSLGSMLSLIGSSAQEGKVAANEAANVVTGLIPQGALIANAASAVDPFTRKVQSGDIGQQIASRLPGARQQLPPRLSGTGQPLANPQQGLGVLLPRSSVTSNDPVLAAFSNAGQTIPNAPSSISFKGAPIQLKPDEQRRWEQQRGDLLRSLTGGYISDPRFRALPPAQQRAILQKVIERADSTASKVVISEMSGDDLRQRWTAGELQSQGQPIPGPDFQPVAAGQ